MKDSVSKSQFNKEMKALEKENKIIDSKMSEYYKSKNNDTFDNVIFNLSFILLNVLVMFFLYLIYSNKEYGIYVFDVFIKNIINSKMPLNITLIALCIVVCKTISNVITIKLGSKNFRLVLSGRLVIKDMFYSRIGYNALPMYEYTLTSSRVSIKNSENIINVKIIGAVLSNLVISIILSVVSLMYIDYGLNVALCVINIVSVILFIAIICFSVSVIVNKGQNSIVVFYISKILYKLKLVKDFDYIYNLLSLKVLSMHDTIVSASKNCISVGISFVENVIIYFLKASVVIVLLESMGVVFDFDKYMYVFISINILENICRLYPIKNKAVLREILICVMYGVFNLRGYMFYFIVLYVLMDYYIGLVVGLVLNLLDGLVISKSAKVFNNAVTKKDVSVRHKKYKKDDK